MLLCYDMNSERVILALNVYIMSGELLHLAVLIALLQFLSLVIVCNEVLQTFSITSATCMYACVTTRP